MKIPSIFRHQNPLQKWHSCNYPKTNSFRLDHHNNNHILNSVFSDSGVETPNSSETTTTSFSTTTESEEFDYDNESLENVVRSVRSSESRLFYEPAGATSSIAAGAGISNKALMKYPTNMEEESVVMEMESEDPYGDFRRSIEEMVETHRIKEWDCLDELLGWYLKVNEKKNHCFIVEAFVDVLVQIAKLPIPTSSNYSTSTSSFSSAFSSFSHSSVQGGANHEIEQQHDQKLLFI